jgi:NHLM bacteriocin system ABC transporter ATP-binding protein
LEGELEEVGQEALEDWISALTTAPATGGRPPADVTLTQGDHWDGPAGQTLASASGTVWLRVEEGGLEFAGREELRLGAGDCFPLAEDGWARSEEGTRLRVVSGAEVARQELLAGALRLFHETMLRWIAAATQERREAERDRLRRRAEADRRARSAAVSRLAGVLTPADGVPPGEPGAAPLLRAAQAVGEAAGVEIRDLASTGRIQSVGDEVDALARGSGVRYRKVILRGRWWETDAGPLLGFESKDAASEEEGEVRPVALLPAGPGRYELWDPATPESRRAVDRGVAESLEPFAYVFYRGLPFRTLSASDLWKFLGFGIRGDVGTLVVTGLVAAVLALAPPVATGLVFDWIIPSADRVQLLHVFVGLVVIAVAMALFGITRSYAMLRVRTRAGPSLQLAVLDRLIRLPLPFFRRYTAGDLADRAGAVNAVAEMLGDATLSTIMSSLVSAGTVVLLFWYSPRLALAAVGVVVVVASFTFITSMLAIRYQRRLQEVEGRLSGLVLQLLHAVSKIRVAGAESRAFARWADVFAEARRQRYRVGELQSNVVAFNDAMVVVASIVIFAVYAWIAQNPGVAITTGRFIAFTAAYGTFLGSALALTGTAVTLLEAVPTMERARPILGTLPETDESRPAPGPLEGRIEVSRVSFRYSEDGPLILKDVSMLAGPGRFIAVVGPSGAGKSTLLRLLMGFEDPTSGSVYYDGQDLASIDASEVRRQIGVVLQTSRLTAGSILSNIVGSSSYTQNDAWRAARMAGLEADLEGMPMGMHTVVSEGGGNLSGGQRQRLLIARALVRRPRIIFFDEATSALDNRTQKVVSDSLERLSATRIVIAHRLSTVVGADTIYVMRAGEVVQEGAYDELMARPGLFADLAARQTA